MRFHLRVLITVHAIDTDNMERPIPPLRLWFKHVNYDVIAVPFVDMDELERPILPVPDDPYYARKLEKQKMEQGLNIDLEPSQPSFYISSGQYEYEYEYEEPKNQVQRASTLHQRTGVMYVWSVRWVCGCLQWILLDA